MTRHLVVVGASLAGLRAVESARRSGFDGRITLVGAEPHLPYDRPPLSKAFLEDDGHDSQPFRSEISLRDELGVELMLGAPATALDMAAKQVLIGDRDLAYDALIIATGAHARTLPGTEHLSGVFALRTRDDAIAIRNALTDDAKVVVIGAGFIGSEIASSASKRGLAVTVVEALPTPLVRAVGETMGAELAALHIRNGTTLLCGSGVRAIEGDGTVEWVVLEDGTRIPADVVVVGAGAIPAVDWLDGSGLSLDNGILCDEMLCAGPNIYAAGDVANWPNAMFGRRMRLEHWTSAAEQGARAAHNAINPDAAKPFSTIPYFWSDWYGVRIQFVGTPLSDEVIVVDGDLESENRTVALYRSGDRLVGVLAVNAQSEIMKYRALIVRGARWDEAVSFAAERCAAHAAKTATAL